MAKRQVGGQIPEVPGGANRHTAETDDGGEDRHRPKQMLSWIKMMLFPLFLIVLKTVMMF